MAPLPKKKYTRARTGKRRSKYRITLPNLTTCPSCKKFKLPHIACPYCGHYGSK